MELVKVEEKRTRVFYAYCLKENKQIGSKSDKDTAKTTVANHQKVTKHQVEVRKDLRTTVRYILE